jgi:hypothetical protein
MVDFATWVEAGAPDLGWERDRFLSAHLANRREASVGVVEGSFIGQFIPRLAEEGFDGTATRCLARLATLAGPEATRHRAWPGTPKGLVGILRRLAPSLTEAGIAVEFVGSTDHERQRIIRIHRASDAIARRCDRVTCTPRAAGKFDPRRSGLGAEIDRC